MARQMVEESPQGDAFTLVLMSSPPRVVVARPALEPSEILREIDALRLSHTSADLPATVPRVRQVVDTARTENPRLARHEVYFLTDLQRLTWAPEAAARPRRPSSSGRPTNSARRPRCSDRPRAAIGREPGGHGASRNGSAVDRRPQRATGGRLKTSAIRPATVNRSSCWSMDGASSRSR